MQAHSCADLNAHSGTDRVTDSSPDSDVHYGYPSHIPHGIAHSESLHRCMQRNNACFQATHLFTLCRRPK